MKTFTIAYSRTLYGNRLFSVLSPSGRAVHLGYSRSGGDKYETSETKAISIANSLTHAVNFGGLDIARVLEDCRLLEYSNSKSERDKPQMKSSVKFRHRTAKLKRLMTDKPQKIVISGMTARIVPE